MTDREGAGLRGAVWMCRTQTEIPGHKQAATTLVEEAFTPEGQRRERRQRNREGALRSVIRQFDAQGRIVEERHSGVLPEQNRVLRYHYDDSGRHERTVWQDSQGERVAESMQYGADGTRTLTAYSAPSEPPDAIGVDPQAALHFSREVAVVMTLFDASGRPVRKVLYDAEERVVRRIGYRYDARGLLVEEGELVQGSIRADNHSVYGYDESGRRVRAENNFGFGAARRTAAYNEYGDVEEERLEGSCLAGQDTAAQLASVWRYRYKYDPHGNWTERITEAAESGAQPVVAVIERRELVYY